MYVVAPLDVQVKFHVPVASVAVAEPEVSAFTLIVPVIAPTLNVAVNGIVPPPPAMFAYTRVYPFLVTDIVPVTLPPRTVRSRFTAIPIVLEASDPWMVPSPELSVIVEVTVPVTVNTVGPILKVRPRVVG